jgi:hypothetical protein
MGKNALPLDEAQCTVLQNTLVQSPKYMCNSLGTLKTSTTIDNIAYEFKKLITQLFCQKSLIWFELSFQPIR